mgnify:CR=1 FL=1
MSGSLGLRAVIHFSVCLSCLACAPNDTESPMSVTSDVPGITDRVVQTLSLIHI